MGSVVASEPDKWLTRRTVSVGSGHGWFDFGKEVETGGGGGGHLCRTRELIIPMLSYREIFYLVQDFYIRRVKYLGFW